MSSRRALVMLLVITIGTLILFSTLFFAGDSNDVTPTKKQTTTHTSKDNADDKIHELIMTVHMEEDEFQILTSLTKAFEKKNPTIHINLTNLIPAENQTYYEALKLRAQLGRMSDLTLMDSNWVEEFAALGYLNDVDDHFIKVPVEKYVGSLLSPLKWNGFYWGVPLDFNPYVLTYREQVVKQFGFNEPAGNLMKWNIQLDRINAANNRKAEALYLNADDPYQLLVLDSEVLSKALKLQGTNSEQLEIRIPRAMQEEQLWGDFKAGRWLFMVTSLSEALQNQTKDAPITITTIPQQPTVVNSEGLLFEGRSFTIAAKTPYKDDALAWIRYVSDKSVLAEWYADTKQLPSIIESYASKELQDTVPKMILDRLDKPVHSLAKPDFPTKVGTLTQTIESVWAGKEKVGVLIDMLETLRATE